MQPLPSAQDSIKSLAEELLKQLREASFDGVGVTRESYGPSETQAMQVLAKVAQAESLRVEYDAAANLVISLPGADEAKPFVACGSHLDSVPEGGNYDGAAGVIAGLLALINLRRENIVPPRTIKVYALRGEESAWFGQAYMGTRALLGAFAPADFGLLHRTTGQTLKSYMRAAGADVERIASGHPLLDPSHVGCYFELHIEQGPVMVARKIPVGIVTGIRGNYRHPSATCIGEAAHSGAVPRWLRKDAVFAFSEFVMRVDRHWQALLEQGQDLVVTLGIASTNSAEHAMSRVPGHMDFALEFRSESAQLLADFEALTHSEAASIGRLRGVRFDLGEPRLTAPATMAPALVELLCGICDRQGIAHERLPSGAGHDAAVFANHGIPSAMIFVRNEPGSHNPDEAMAMDDYFLGLDVLAQALVDAAEVLT
ncbi:MAG: N-carbamoyl-L-amino-acid hydrolase [Gammaproteobacteria bacterium]|jgi:N-carbamoyl-L-amino-acid hydrolase